MARSSEGKAVENLIHMMGSPTFSPAVFANAVMNQHPTHQQTLMRNFVHVIYAWADAYALGHCDLRNEATGKAAHEFREAIIREGIVFPYI